MSGGGRGDSSFFDEMGSGLRGCVRLFCGPGGE